MLVSCAFQYGADVVAEDVSQNQAADAATTKEDKNEPLIARELRGAELRSLIRESQREIRKRVLEADADIIPRTQAHNRKSAHQSLEEEREHRAEVVAEQIRVWRSMLPNLIKQFAKIPDYRKPGSVKHKITVLMIFWFIRVYFSFEFAA